MRFYKALFLASISTTIAKPLTSDPTAPDFSVFSTTDSSSADNPDSNALPPVDSRFIATADKGSSGSSDPEKQGLDNFSLDNQNELDGGFLPNPIAAVNTDNSKSECSSGTNPTSNTLRTREIGQQCFPTMDEPSEEELEALKREDAADTVWVAAYKVANPDEGISKLGQYWCQTLAVDLDPLRILPLCCRGGQLMFGNGPFTTVAQEDCVEMIEGRPRCRDLKRRFCCWLLGLGELFSTRGIDCRPMYANLA